MAIALFASTLCAFAMWCGLLLLPGGAYRTRERLEPEDPFDSSSADLGDLTVLIPARDEAATVARTLDALARQGRGLEVVLVDDRSSDGTAAIAVAAAVASGAASGSNASLPKLTLRVLGGAPLAPGWGGKLWALQQGLECVTRPYTLLLDADIELAPGTIAALLAQAREHGLSLVSIMAKLSCENFWERLLVPPFVFFFKLIYPFSRVNDARRRSAAAAGGCVLVETAVLRAVGAFGSLRDALIDDCTLAARVKGEGYRIWLGMSTSVRSLRRYARLVELWSMVSRTAYTQLRYSAALLIGVSLLMLIAFIAPLLALGVAADVSTRILAVATIAGMCFAYSYMVRFYGLDLLWTATLPAAAVLYLLMTWSSALAYWRGVRATWKERTYEVSN